MQRDGVTYWLDENQSTSVKNSLLELSNEVGLVWSGKFLGLAVQPQLGTSGQNFFTLVLKIYYLNVKIG